MNIGQRCFVSCHLSSVVQRGNLHLSESCLSLWLRRSLPVYLLLRYVLDTCLLRGQSKADHLDLRPSATYLVRTYWLTSAVEVVCCFNRWFGVLPDILVDLQLTVRSEAVLGIQYCWYLRTQVGAPKDVTCIKTSLVFPSTWVDRV